MQSTKKITVDVQRRDVLPPIYCKQYDANTRYIEMTILDGGEAFTLPTNPVFMVGVLTAGHVKFLYDQLVTATAPLGLTVRVDAQVWAAAGIASGTFTYNGTAWTLNGSAVDLADYGVEIIGTPESGNAVTVSISDAVTYSQNVVTFAIHPSALLSAGDAFVELYICDGDEQISSFKLTLRVESAACPPTMQTTTETFVLLTAQIKAYVNQYLSAHPAAISEGIGDYIEANPEMITDEVDAWIEANPNSVKTIISAVLADHPDWVTTVTDGAISYEKLNAELKGKVDVFDALGLSVVDGKICVTYTE